MLATNVINPNGDGLNDVLYVENLEFFPDNELVIMDRWGAELFRMVGYSNEQPWAGDNNGMLLPVGNYILVLQLDGAPRSDGSRKRRFLKTVVSIIR